MSWIVNIGDTVVFHKQTHSFATGAVVNADALPEFHVFAGTATGAVLGATMVLMDSTGFYQGSFTVGASTFTAASYCSIRTQVVVGGATAADITPFIIAPTTVARIGARMVSWSSTNIDSISSGVSVLAGADPAAVPAATASWMSKLDWVAMRLKDYQTFNRGTGVATYYNSATSSVGSHTVTDDGTVTTIPKIT